MTRDWNPNAIEPPPVSPTTAASPTVARTPATVPSATRSKPPPRGSRVGPILFTLGGGLVAIDFLLSSIAYDAIYNSPSTASFQWLELALGLGQIVTAVGVLLGTTGWILDKQATASAQGLTSRSERGPRRLVGQILVALGAAAVAAAVSFEGVVEMGAYSNATFNLPGWTFA